MAGKAAFSLAPSLPVGERAGERGLRARGERSRGTDIAYCNRETEGFLVLADSHMPFARRENS